MSYLELYNRIIKLTKEHNMSGKELGNLLGLKKSPLTDWKNRKSTPTLEQLIKICEIFAISSDYLLFGKVQEQSNDETELLENYRLLDSRGKHKLHTTIYEEIDRVKIETNLRKKGNIV